jgi:hypothetical protein
MEGAVVSSRVLLGKLSTVLAEKYVLLRGVGMEIVELDDLESMNACATSPPAVTTATVSRRVACRLIIKHTFFLIKGVFPSFTDS